MNRLLLLLGWMDRWKMRWRGTTPPPASPAGYNPSDRTAPAKSRPAARLPAQRLLAALLALLLLTRAADAGQLDDGIATARMPLDGMVLICRAISSSLSPCSLRAVAALATSAPALCKRPWTSSRSWISLPRLAARSSMVLWGVSAKQRLISCWAI
jgi:hypothetical protein